MKIKQYTKEEMLAIEKEEEGFPVRKRWYKHQDKEVYQYQLNLFEDVPVFVEVVQ
jgi:hypothetical protein